MSIPSRGMTLVEVVVALTIFMLVAFGLAAAATQSQRLAHRNVLRNTLWTVAQGYIEQIKSISLVEIEAALADPDTQPIPTRSISALEREGDLELLDVLFLDGPDPPVRGGNSGSNHKQLLIDLRESEEGVREILMDAWFDLDIRFLGSDELTYEVLLRFEGELQRVPGTRTRGVLRTVRTDPNRISR